MSFAINTNVSAMNVLFNLNTNQAAMSKASNELSSGYKINSAADDAAGLAIANKMTNQITGLNRGVQNAQDGLSMLQTAEGGISSIQDMLGRMRDLALEAKNGTATQSDSTKIVGELKELQAEITRTAQTTTFNTQTLLTGLFTKGVSFQVGANADAQDVISLTAAAANMSATGLAINTGLISAIGSAITVATAQGNASALISALDKALSSISNFRAQVGAVEDRLNFAVQNLQNASNNLTTAKSRIMDTNMAATMTEFSKNQILVNAGISMLAQANQTPGMVLKLLG